MLRLVRLRLFIVLFVAAFSLMACGGSEPLQGEGGNLSASPGYETWFPFYKGLESTFTDGNADILTLNQYMRSNVVLSVLDGDVLHIESTLDYGTQTQYHANIAENYEIIIEGNAVKLSKSTVTINWTGEETWVQVWEYNPPVTLIPDRTTITAGSVISGDTAITFSGHTTAINDFTTGTSQPLLPMTGSVDFEVIISNGTPVSIDSMEIETYQVNITWAEGLNVIPLGTIFSYFEPFSLLSPGFRLAKGEGIVAFGDGVVKE